MILSRAIVIAAFAAAPLLCTAGEPLSFKGVPFNAPLDDFLAVHKDGFDCRDSPDKPETRCFSRDGATFAQERVQRISVRFVDGRLASVGVTFKPSSYTAIRQALTDKHGPAKEFESELQTAMGAKFEQRESLWKLPDGDILLSRFSSVVTEGRLFMSSAAMREAEEQKRKAMPPAKSDT